MKKNVLDFKIQRLTWTLYVVNPKELEDEDTQSLGETFYTDYKIKLADVSNYSTFKSALIHELTHAVRWTYGHLSSVGIEGWPQAEMEEQIANTVEVHGEEIINLAYDILEKLGRKKDE